MQAETIKSFRITLAEPKLFKDSIQVVSELISEANLRVKPQSIELVAMDPANVSMVILRLYSSIFTEYMVGQEMALGINLGNLKQILRRIGANDILTMEFEEGGLLITLKGTSTRTFKFPIIDIEDKEAKIPELKFPVKITMPSSHMAEAVEDIAVVAESTSFTADRKMFSMKGSGDLSDASIEIPADESTKITATDNKVTSRYSIEYLKKLISGSKLSDTVTIEFNKDYPLRMEFKDEGKFEMAFILAPRVEND